MRELGHDVTATCNINTKRKKETETVQKIKEVSLLERKTGELDSGLLGTRFTHNISLPVCS